MLTSVAFYCKIKMLVWNHQKMRGEFKMKTFGEKLASLRKQANMTQNDLADKLMVSRQAITKWENDKGLPDIDNLVMISKIFNVTMEDLLEYKIETIELKEGSTVETIDKENSKFKVVDKFIKERFAEADSISYLSREIKLNVWEEIIDFILPSMPSGAVRYARDGVMWYSYLVEKGENQYLVLVHKDKLMIRKLEEKFEKKIVVDGYKYSKVKNGKIK